MNVFDVAVCRPYRPFERQWHIPAGECKYGDRRVECVEYVEADLAEKWQC
jgi:hypothetical protein